VFPPSKDKIVFEGIKYPEDDLGASVQNPSKPPISSHSSVDGVLPLGLSHDQPPPLRAPAPPGSQSRDLFEVSELRAQLTLAQIGDRVTSQIWHSCTGSWSVGFVLVIN
jgi:hypothetical protein